MIHYILIPIIIGTLATLAMSLFLWTITYLKICDVNMERAIGSWFTGKEKNSLLPGMLIHLCFGILFCFAYLYVFNVVPNPMNDVSFYAFFGAGLGFVHGIIVALCLVILVAPDHPLRKYQKAGFAVAAYHFFAHIIYGFAVGALYLWLFHG